jgi:hypothetical protein
MSTEEFIIRVFCLIDDELKIVLKGRKLRHGGFQPALSDSEVLTMEVVGEFLGHDADKSLWQYFKEHWLYLFPKLPDRTTFVRHAANLHILKQLLQEKIAQGLGVYTDRLHIIDGLPMPVCNIARAFSSQIFKGFAAYGHCAAKQESYYGLHGHIVISSIGVITSATFTPANIDERDVCPELVKKLIGLILGDKGFIRPFLRAELVDHGLYLETPVRKNMKEARPPRFLKWMTGTRRLIETVIGQLAERFHLEKIRARDLWHQWSRFWRKILAHTVCVKINLSLGNEPLQFERLLSC